MLHFASHINSMVVDDPLVLNCGALKYAQEVLVPELLVMLVREDMEVGDGRARQILEESEENGDLLNSV
jgi:hypothetical protein